MVKLRIERYSTEYEAMWDNFVEETAFNGSFLQEWKFLNYHKDGKFEDCSLLFFLKDKLIAVCPACVEWMGSQKVFFSHKGSTYGGILIGKEWLRMEKISYLFKDFEKYLKEQGFSKCVLKMTMDLLCCYPQEAVKFFLCYSGYKEITELNIYIDYSKYDRSILNNFSKMKRRNVRKCLEMGMQLQPLRTENEVHQFHEILTKNLEKYGIAPVHTAVEMLDLKKRLGKYVEFYGAFLKGKLLAGTMVFIFEKTMCAHTQYLAADPEYAALNPMAFIYYKMAEQYHDRQFRYLSWGTATEHGGKIINWSLANSKEEFGSLHIINSIFEKEF